MIESIAVAGNLRDRGRDIEPGLAGSNLLETKVIDLGQVKVTPRDQQVLDLLVQGCSNKEIAGQLNISPRTVKQHLRTLFLRAGIREGRKRVKLAIAMFAKGETHS
jgi:DNA-binding NarL/FixJ family response regulator